MPARPSNVEQQLAYPYNAKITVEYRKCDECGREWRGNYKRRLHADRPECPGCYHRGPEIRKNVARTWKVVKRRVQAYRCQHCGHTWVPNLKARRPDVSGAGTLPPNCPSCRRPAL